MTSLFAVMPVLVGPLQVLLALLPAILAAVGGMLLALFKPSGFKKLLRFFWHQKLFTALLVATGVALWHGYPKRLWSSPRASGEVSDEARASAWPMLRGGPERMGWSSGDDPTAPAANWAWTEHATVFGSPTVAGGRVYFSTVTDLGPFTPQGKGAIVCCDAETGRELWRYDDGGTYRATFSAPVVAEERIVVGEGLHITADARVTCLDLSGRRMWQHFTKSHVEATPCIHSGRVYVSAAGDGFYCFSLTPNEDGSPRILWHLEGEKYPDCESSPVCDGATVWFGLGEGGNAIVAVDAETGEERWRTVTPHPVFTGPTLADGKLYVGVGNGNFIVSAEELRARRIEEMRESGASQSAIDATYKEMAPYGSVWRLDAATGAVDWTFPLKETVLDSIACRNGRLFFGSRDGTFYALTTEGKELAHWNAGATILASAAAGRSHVYVVSNAGRLHCLKADTLAPVWDMTLQAAGASPNPTLSSSPTLAGGRVYVGTDAAGLRCVGTTEPPEPPVWTGASHPEEEVNLPEQAEVAWTWPGPTDKRSPATIGPPWSEVPLMPLGDSLYLPVVAAGQGDPDSSDVSLVRLRCTGKFLDEPKVEWTTRIGLISGLLGSGDRILCVSDADIKEGGPRTISCRSAKDGGILWTATMTRPEAYSESESAVLVPGNGGFTVDHERAYVCSPAQVASLDLRDGSFLWKRDLTPARRKSEEQSWPPFGFGQVAEREGVLIVVDAESVSALDAATGRLLWRRDFDGLDLVAAPLAGGGQVLLKTQKALTALSMVDGRSLWQSDRAVLPFAYHGPIVANAAVILNDLLERPRPPVNNFDGERPLQIPVLDRSSGEVRGEIPRDFKNNNYTGAVRLFGDRAFYFGSLRVRAHDLTTGESQDWVDDDRLRQPLSICELGGRLYVATAMHGIVCLRGAQPGAQP